MSPLFISLLSHYFGYHTRRCPYHDLIFNHFCKLIYHEILYWFTAMWT